MFLHQIGFENIYEKNHSLKVNKYAEGGEVEGPMEVPELTPEQETSLDMQMEEALPPMEETEKDFDTV